MAVHGTFVLAVVVTLVAIARTDAMYGPEHPCVGDGVTFTDVTGTIKSPGYQKKLYPNNVKCQWRIIAPYEYQEVKIKFTYFHIEGHRYCSYDSVSIYDDSTGELLGKFCGCKSPDYIPARHAIRIVFTTDHSVGYGGFCLEWNTCGGRGKQWALLVATWKPYRSSYRMQAGICHAYQILRRQGIPEEQIVTMMWDNIAYHKKNPTQGIIINRRGGPDVYGGVVIDYKGWDVNPRNFLAVLSGQRSVVAGVGSGRVIESSQDDHIFVNVVGFGWWRRIRFQSFHRRSWLRARRLVNTLTSMHDNGQFAKLVFYLGMHLSGSMFANILPNNIGVYATTSSLPWQWSWVKYWDRSRGVFLGNQYGVSWMEDADQKNLCEQTLQDQYEVMRARVRGSTVTQYGDLSIANMTVADFFGCNCSQLSVQSATAALNPEPLVADVSSDLVYLYELYKELTRHADTVESVGMVNLILQELAKKMGGTQEVKLVDESTAPVNVTLIDTVPDVLVNITTLFNIFITTNDPTEAGKIGVDIMDQLKLTKDVDDTLKAIVSQVEGEDLQSDEISETLSERSETPEETPKTESEQTDILEQFYDAEDYFRQRCFNLDENVFAESRLVELLRCCEKGVSAEKLKAAIDVVCTGNVVEEQQDVVP